MQRSDAIPSTDEDLATEREEVLALAALDEAETLFGELYSTRPPCIDDYDDYDDPYLEAVPPEVNYPSWTAENSFVVSGPLAGSRRRGRRFENWEQVRAWAKAKYGFIYEEIRLPGGWAVRVPKPGVTK